MQTTFVSHPFFPWTLDIRNFFIPFRLKLQNGIVNLTKKKYKNQINRNPFIFIHSSSRSYKTSVLSKFNIVVEFRIEIKLHKNDPFSDFLSNSERKTSIGFAPYQQSSHVLHMVYSTISLYSILTSPYGRNMEEHSILGELFIIAQYFSMIHRQLLSTPRKTFIKKVFHVYRSYLNCFHLTFKNSVQKFITFGNQFIAFVWISNSKLLFNY